jgi:hypothetical protein
LINPTILNINLGLEGVDPGWVLTYVLGSQVDKGGLAAAG